MTAFPKCGNARLALAVTATSILMCLSVNQIGYAQEREIHEAMSTKLVVKAADSQSGVCELTAYIKMMRPEGVEVNEIAFRLQKSPRQASIKTGRFTGGTLLVNLNVPKDGKQDAPYAIALGPVQGGSLVTPPGQKPQKDGYTSAVSDWSETEQHMMLIARGAKLTYMAFYNPGSKEILINFAGKLSPQDKNALETCVRTLKHS